MIKNDRQLTITQQKMRRALESAESVEEVDATTAQSLREFASELLGQIDEYLEVRDGNRHDFPLYSVDDLAASLIKARIARRLTQKQLAETIGVSEQNVQRDEDGGYQRAALSRLADIADVLEYRLVGALRPCEATTPARGVQAVTRAQDSAAQLGFALGGPSREGGYGSRIIAVNIGILQGSHEAGAPSR
ncbi:MAG: helix-turn-helix domain-containing protein [Acidimicrobiales bacterium]|nr:helix-turn-helix domain-containing protein [Acidimicrobiales bacterium]